MIRFGVRLIMVVILLTAGACFGIRGVVWWFGICGCCFWLLWWLRLLGDFAWCLAYLVVAVSAFFCLGAVAVCGCLLCVIVPVLGGVR